MADSVLAILLKVNRQNTGEIAKLRDEILSLIPAGNSVSNMLSKLGTAVRNPFVAAAVAIAGTTVAVAKNAIAMADTVEQLDLLSARTGTSVRDLQVLQRVLVNAGLGADDATQALTFMNRAIATQDPLLKKLGITTRDAGKAVLQLSTILAGSDDTAKKTEITYRLLGKSSGDLLGIMDNLAPAFARTQAAMEKSGGLLSDETLEKARAFDTLIDSIKGKFADLGLKAKASSLDVVTLLVGMGTAAQDLLNKLRQGIPSGGAIGAFLPPVQAAPKGPPLPNVGPKVPETAREHRLKEIARLLHLGDTEARKLLASLEEVEDAGKRADLLDKLRLGPEVPQSVKALNTEAEELAMLFGMSGDRAMEMAEALHVGRVELEKAAIAAQLMVGPLVPDEIADLNAYLERSREAPFIPNQADQLTPVQRMTNDMRAIADEALETANMMRDAMFGITDALTQGIQGLLEAFVFRTQSISKAIVGLFKSMVSELLAQLARLAAIKIFRLILGDVTAVVPTPANLGNIPLPSPAFAPTSGGSFARSAGGGAGAFRAAAPVTNVHVNISAFDTRSASDQFADPYGAVRRAFRRSAEVQAA